MEIVVENGLSNFVYDIDYEVFVVNAGEGFAGDFVNLEEVVEIGGGIILAAIAVAFWIDRAEVFFILGVFNINAAV